jgi:hypothetical protein
MKRLLKPAMVVLFTVCLMQTAVALTIDYSVTNLYDNRWEYSYTIINKSEADIFADAIAIKFQYEDYAGLEFEIGPLTWDDSTWMWIWKNDWMLALMEPNTLGSPIDGELLAFNIAGIAPGESEVIIVSFDWLGSGIPGSQLFEIVDANTWATVGYGFTTSADVPEIPEPQTLVLLGTGLVALAAYRRNRKAVKR